MNLNHDALHEHAQSREPSVKQQAASDELRVARERLSSEFDGAFTALKRSLFVERKVLGLVLFDTGYRAACAAALGLSALMTMLVATWLLLASLRRGLQIWTNAAWWSDLVLGVLLIGLLAGAAYGVRRYVHRSTLAATKRALDKNPSAQKHSASGTPA